MRFYSINKKKENFIATFIKNFGGPQVIDHVLKQRENLSKIIGKSKDITDFINKKSSFIDHFENSIFYNGNQNANNGDEMNINYRIN